MRILLSVTPINDLLGWWVPQDKFTLGVGYVKLRCAFQYLWDRNDLDTGECECEQPRYATKHSKADHGDDHGVDQRNPVVKYRSFEHGGHSFGLHRSNIIFCE